MNSSECSSAEDDRRQRVAQAAAQSHKKARPARKRDASASSSFIPSAPLSDHSDLVGSHTLAESDIPSMKSIPQLLIDHQHLQQNIDGSPICLAQMMSIQSSQSRPAAAAASASSSSASSSGVGKRKGAPAVSASSSSSTFSEDDLASALRTAILSKQPDTQGHWVRDEFDRRLNVLPIPEFYDQSGLNNTPSQEQLTTQLMRQQYFLKVQTAQLESELLAEAGTFVSKTTGKEYTFPPCSQGNNCVGMTQRMRLQTTGFILTMVMFDHEYEYFINTGESPRASRPCVACSRAYITSCTVFDRAVRMCGEGQVGDSVLAVQRASNGPVVKQFYQNLKDQERGYHGIHMIASNSNPDDPILEPICLPGRSVLFCTFSAVLFNKQSGRPRIVVDQNAIIWKAQKAPLPQIGQNLMAFCGGASRK